MLLSTFARRRRPRDPVIGPVGARRAIAFLVIGDAVLGGLFFGVLLRPERDAERPARAVTATTIAPAALAAPDPSGDVQPLVADAAPAPSTSVAPSTSTTVTTSTSPTSTPRVAPTTVPSTAPRAAEVTTTVPTSTPSTTLAPATTTQPPPPLGDSSG